MADELYQRVSNPAPQDYRIGQLWSDFDRFCSGRLITVGYGKEGTCFMKLLDERSDQIWEMRSKDPQPQIRVFGRFVGIDQFLATHASFRGDLGYPSKSKFEGNNWPAEIARCKTIWNQVCHNSPPHEGDSINDYISSNVVEVGKLH